MRWQLVPLGAVMALLAGCTPEAAATPRPVPPPYSAPPPPPAADAGGACILWDYALIKKKIGADFTVAASGRVGDISSCVVQTEQGDYPYLTLSVVESSRADAAVFRQEAPRKSTGLKVGKAGYRLVTKASDGHGPVVEIGWLSDAAQVQTLKYTFAADAGPDAVERMTTDLAALARTVNTSKGQ